MCTPTAHSLATNAPYEVDLRLKPVQDDWERDLAVRFGLLEQAIREAIIDENVLGAQQARTANPVLLAVNAYDFPRKAERAQAFNRWLKRRIDSGILEVTSYEGGTVASHTGWQNIYVRRSYSKGVDWAHRKLAEKGIVVAKTEIAQIMAGPVHADTLGLMYTRAFDQLEGITGAMSQKISRVLSEDMVAGANPRTIASHIAGRNGVVREIGLVRARTLARTETAFAQSEASLNRYTDYRVAKVTFLYAGGPCPSNVCPPLDGTTMTVQAAHGMIPLHPNCGCAWLPEV